MYHVELRALLPQCIRIGTFFFLTLEANGQTSTGRDEYHLNLTVEPGERIAALGRVCIVQFDAACVGRTDHGVSSPIPTTNYPHVLRLRTNHVQNQHNLVRTVYLWVNNSSQGRALRLDSPLVNIITLEPGHFLLYL